MPPKVLPDDEFIRLFEELGPITLAQRVGMAERGIFARRSRLERKYGRQIAGPEHKYATRSNVQSDARQEFTVSDGIVLVGSDAHYRPGIISTAHRAFVKFCHDMEPAAVIKNGDVMDFPSISRHAPIGWETRPSVIQEIECAQERLDEIEKAAPKAELFWPLGNHDSRFESRLSTIAPEYARVHGVHLKDHFNPRWTPCWSVWVNDSVVVKHRYRGGIHATRNNTMNAGMTMVTGHLHSLKVTPFSDYRGTRWGVDCGTMADPDGAQFLDYTEDSPKDWRSGFVVLTFRNGELLQPEMVMVRNESEVDFRGSIHVV